MFGKLKNNKCTVILERVSDDEFWLRFSFVHDGMIVDEPVEIHDDSDEDDEFISSIAICNAFWETKHVKWKINAINLEEWIKNPRIALLDECRKIKIKYRN